MIIFILIFFATIIIVGAAAVFGFSFYLKRRAKSLESNNQKQIVGDAPQYRSLFEPDEEEIRFLEREEAAKTEAEKLETARRDLLEKAERVKEFQTIFLENPTRKNIIELLLSAAGSESAKIFGETAESVLKVFRENKIKNLTATDLAGLLESHIGLLSQQERASGAMFWLKQEIERLRRDSEGNLEKKFTETQ